MVEERIVTIQVAALERIHGANSPEDLERVRVEVLGRKGSLAEISKEMGKLAAEERARAGKLLNAAKQAIEEAIEGRKAQSGEAALRARLDAEWIDLTLPAPGPRA